MILWHLLVAALIMNTVKGSDENPSSSEYYWEYYDDDADADVPQTFKTYVEDALSRRPSDTSDQNSDQEVIPEDGHTTPKLNYGSKHHDNYHKANGQGHHKQKNHMVKEDSHDILKQLNIKPQQDLSPGLITNSSFNFEEPQHTSKQQHPEDDFFDDKPSGIQIGDNNSSQKSNPYEIDKSFNSKNDLGLQKHNDTIIIHQFEPSHSENHSLAVKENLVSDTYKPSNTGQSDEDGYLLIEKLEKMLKSENSPEFSGSNDRSDPAGNIVPGNTDLAQGTKETTNTDNDGSKSDISVKTPPIDKLEQALKSEDSPEFKENILKTSDQARTIIPSNINLEQGTEEKIFTDQVEGSKAHGMSEKDPLIEKLEKLLKSEDNSESEGGIHKTSDTAGTIIPTVTDQAQKTEKTIRTTNNVNASKSDIFATKRMFPVIDQSLSRFVTQNNITDSGKNSDSVRSYDVNSEYPWINKTLEHLLGSIALENNLSEDTSQANVDALNLNLNGDSARSETSMERGNQSSLETNSANLDFKDQTNHITMVESTSSKNGSSEDEDNPELHSFAQLDKKHNIPTEHFLNDLTMFLAQNGKGSNKISHYRENNNDPIINQQHTFKGIIHSKEFDNDQSVKKTLNHLSKHSYSEGAKRKGHLPGILNLFKEKKRSKILSIRARKPSVIKKNIKFKNQPSSLSRVDRFARERFPQLAMSATQLGNQDIVKSSFNTLAQNNALSSSKNTTLEQNSKTDRLFILGNDTIDHLLGLTSLESETRDNLSSKTVGSGMKNPLSLDQNVHSKSAFDYNSIKSNRNSTVENTSGSENQYVHTEVSDYTNSKLKSSEQENNTSGMYMSAADINQSQNGLTQHPLEELFTNLVQFVSKKPVKRKKIKIQRPSKVLNQTLNDEEDKEEFEVQTTNQDNAIEGEHVSDVSSDNSTNSHNETRENNAIQPSNGNHQENNIALINKIHDNKIKVNRTKRRKLRRKINNKKDAALVNSNTEDESHQASKDLNETKEIINGNKVSLKEFEEVTTGSNNNTHSSISNSDLEKFSNIDASEVSKGSTKSSEYITAEDGNEPNENFKNPSNGSNNEKTDYHTLQESHNVDLNLRKDSEHVNEFDNATSNPELQKDKNFSEDDELKTVGKIEIHSISNKEGVDSQHNNGDSTYMTKEEGSSVGNINLKENVVSDIPYIDKNLKEKEDVINTEGFNTTDSMNINNVSQLNKENNRRKLNQSNTLETPNTDIGDTRNKVYPVQFNILLHLCVSCDKVNPTTNKMYRDNEDRKINFASTTLAAQNNNLEFNNPTDERNLNNAILLEKHYILRKGEDAHELIKVEVTKINDKISNVKNVDSWR